MSSDELVSILYKISDSFNETSIYPTIKFIIGLFLLFSFVACYIYLEIWERKIIRTIINE